MNLRLAVFACALIAACGSERQPDVSRTEPSRGIVQPLEPATATALWVDRTQRIDGRLFAALQDQPSRRRVLQYGGFRLDDGVLADTWEWDGYGWIRRIPDDDPGPRLDASTVWDPIRQRVLLYGGFSRSQLTPTDTLLWEWDGTNWSTIRSEQTPAARACSSMVWDPKESRVLLFGGFVGADGEKTTVQAAADLWSFDGREWTEVDTPTRPSAGACNGMVYDSARDRFVLQVGFDYIQNQAGNLLLGYRVTPETWVWDRSSWSKLPTNLSSFDLGVPVLAEEAPGSIQLFVEAQRRGALFSLVDDQWVERQARSEPLLGSSAVWSTVDQALLVTNGGPPTAAGAIDADLLGGDWLVSSVRPFERKPDAVAPPARRSAASAQLADGRTLMFGGIDAAQAFVDDMYVWDGGRWSVVSPSGPKPSPRANHVMAPIGTGRVLLFGGQDDASVLGDTWTFDVATTSWTQVPVPEGTGPSPRRRSTMASSGESAVLFGGETALSPVVYDAETWSYREPSGWSRLDTPIAPSPRSHAALAHVAGGAWRLYGGYDSVTSSTSAEQWQLDGTTWSLLGNYAPIFRRGHRLVGDGFGGLVMLGGTGSFNAPDVLELTPTEVLSVDVRVREDHQTLPSRRTLEIAESNPRTGGIIRFGGQESDDTFLADTWQLVRYGAPCTEGGNECGPTMACTEGVCCETTNCGPCRTCAAPGSLGLCTARGTMSPEPGCEAGLACSASGQCRRANESLCTENAQCASEQCLTAGRESGICCSKEGCAVRCVGSELQQPDGTRVTCGAYGCEGQSCRVSCTSISDCADGFVCDQRGACVRGDTAGEDDGGCNCRIDLARGATAPWHVGLLPLLLVLARRRGRHHAKSAS